MKNRNFIKNSILLLLPISMGVGVLFGTSNKHETEVSAYTGASLPTTIELNDPSESTIRNYYSNLNSLSENERKGDNLLKNLKTILSNGQKYYNYDSGDLVWKMYEITDRDWDMSPASSTTYGTYNASTNTITNYQYGSNSSPKNNPYVRAYYMDRSQTNIVTAWGSHQQTDPNGINREHLWAKAEGFDGSGAAGARGDPMHLVAANGYANNIHSNNFYGYVDKSKSYVDVKNKFSVLGHNYSGYSKTYPSSSATVFEPQDCDKGDIARAIFYMAARYNNIAGKSASQETFDADNPNLLLTNDLSKWKSSGYTSTATSPGYHGLITDLLEWNRIDKPDAYEIHRNNLLYTNFTNNRNPFIDFPEWADYIWGNQSVSASPSTDALNGGGGGTTTVTVTSLEITKKPTKLVYNVGDSLDLTGMVVKANKSDGTSQTLNNTQYTVTPTGALKTSDTEVVVSYSGKSASFAIAVKSSGGGSTEVIAPIGTTLLFEPFTGFAANALPTSPGTSSSVYNSSSVAYTCNKGGSDTKIYNESLATGEAPEILVSKSNGSFVISNVPTGGAKEISVCYKANKTVSLNCSSSDYTVSGSNKNYKLTLKEGSVVAPSTINLTFLNSSTKDNCRVDDIEIKVVTAGEASQENVDVSSIVLNENTLSLEIGASERLTPTISPDTATIKLVSWSSNNSSVVEVSDEGEITAKSAGTAIITCSALDGSGITATCQVTVKEPVTLQSLSLSGEYATEFYLNDEFSNTGMIVTAHYSDGSEVDVSDEAECSGFDSTTTGPKTITVSYGGVTTTYSVTVKETRLDSNQRLFVASKQGVGNGENLTSYQDDPITVVFKKNTSSNYPKYYSTTQSYRLYWGNSLTISSTKKITQIEFEMASSDSVGANTISADVGNLTGNKWTGNANDITFTVAGTSGQRNIVSIKVTYDEDSEDIVVLTSISLSGTYKTNFFVGDNFSSEGLVVTAHYSDSSYKEVTPTSISHQSMSTAGEKTVTVSYTEGSATKDAEYSITVTAVITTSIELTGNYRTTFIQGEEYDPTGMRITEHYNNGGTSAAHYPTSQGCTITGYNKDEIGEQTIRVDWNGVYTTYTVNVIARPSAKVITQSEGYFKVTDSIHVGDKILIVNETGKKQLNGFSGTTTIIGVADSFSTNPKDEYPLTVVEGNSKNTFGFKTSDNKYLYWSSGNTLEKNDSLTNNSSWNISISDGNAIITNVQTPDRFLQYNSSNPRFACYLSTSKQQPVQLYRYETKTETNEYIASIDLTKAVMSAQSILDTACSAKNVINANWSSVKNLITPFLTDTTTDDYKALMFGEAKSSELQGNILEDFLARYDLITDLYGYENFIKVGDDSRNTGVIRKTSIKIETNPTAIVVMILATSGLISIGGYFFFRRKKED